MRRKEFAVEDRREAEQFLEEMSYGFLGTAGENGDPAITPLNFVYFRGALYFHGSQIGAKMDNLRRQSRVCFCVAREYALIPSYFTDAKYACPATAFFKSVLIRGRAEIVQDPAEKAEVFASFMRKLQPEGGYAPIDLNDEGYARQIRGTAIVKIRVEEMTAKFKFGQNWPEEKRSRVERQLLERGRDADADTVEQMRRYGRPKAADSNFAAKPADARPRDM